MAGKTMQPSIKMVWGIAKSPELKLTDEETEGATMTSKAEGQLDVRGAGREGGFRRK